MADMRVSGETKKNFVTPEPEVPTYPPGLRIRLSKEEADKVGFLKAPEIGATYAIMGLVEVVGVESEADDRRPNDFRVELQITDLALESEGEKTGTATTLYGE